MQIKQQNDLMDALFFIVFVQIIYCFYRSPLYSLFFSVTIFSFSCLSSFYVELIFSSVFLSPLTYPFFLLSVSSWQPFPIFFDFFPHKRKHPEHHIQKPLIVIPVQLTKEVEKRVIAYFLLLYIPILLPKIYLPAMG